MMIKRLFVLFVVGLLMPSTMASAEPPADMAECPAGVDDDGLCGQQDGPPPELRERMLKLRSKLLRKRIGLDEERAQRCEAIFARFDEERRSIRADMKKSRRALRELEKSESEDDAAYEALVTRMLEARSAEHDLRMRQFASLRKELSGREQARLLRELRRLKRRIGKHMHRAQKKRRRGGKRSGSDEAWGEGRRHE